jgi:hypothetical protein
MATHVHIPSTAGPANSEVDRLTRENEALKALLEIKTTKLEYNGFGLFVAHVPDSCSMEKAHGLGRAWKGLWRQTDTPKVPLLILPTDISIEKFTDPELQLLGLMRIPTELSSAG